jgi:hypothetical protein
MLRYNALMTQRKKEGTYIPYFLQSKNLISSFSKNQRNVTSDLFPSIKKNDYARLHNSDRAFEISTSDSTDCSSSLSNKDFFISSD